MTLLRTRPSEPVVWAEFFGNERPVELEIGPGKGMFLVGAALARPDHNFVGVEIAAKYARKCAERAEKHGANNVAVVCADGRYFLQECVPPASLCAVHVYFPDPWWKKRHKKRRVFTYEFVDLVARALPAGAMLNLATDVEEYFHVMIQAVDASSAFSRIEDLAADSDVAPPVSMTNFERKYRVEGRPIFRARYVRQ